MTPPHTAAETAAAAVARVYFGDLWGDDVAHVDVESKQLTKRIAAALAAAEQTGYERGRDETARRVLALAEEADRRVRESIPASAAERLIAEGSHTVRIRDLRAAVASPAPTETVITCTHGGRPEHRWDPGASCPDALTPGTWAVRPAPTEEAQ
jgi:hypothetical protein